MHVVFGKGRQHSPADWVHAFSDWRKFRRRGIAIEFISVRDSTDRVDIHCTKYPCPSSIQRQRDDPAYSTVWKMGWLKLYLTPTQLERLKEHRYCAEGTSLFEVFMQPYWRWLVTKVPLWVAPNTITMAGIICAILHRGGRQWEVDSGRVHCIICNNRIKGGWWVYVYVVWYSRLYVLTIVL